MRESLCLWAVLVTGDGDRGPYYFQVSRRWPTLYSDHHIAREAARRAERERPGVTAAAVRVRVTVEPVEPQGKE